jgi:chemotaxis protein CheC
MGDNDFGLSDERKDALREIGNICAGNAATAISQLVNKKIEINVPDVLFIPIEDVPKIVGEDALVVGLAIRILGDFPSFILLVFSQKDALELASLLTGKKLFESMVITEMERSALKELGMILANAYLQTLAVFVNWGLVPTVPQIIEDMAEALIDYILIEISDVSRYALLIKSEFREVSTKVTGHFFLIPNPEGLQVILKATEF